MLRKLLKYDFRANLKIFLFIWPAIILLAVLSRIILQADTGSDLYALLSTSSIFIFILAFAAANIFVLVITVIRFYAGLLGKEGYLMFTLPVKPWQLIVSKFIVAVVFMGVTAILSLGSALILLIDIESFFEAVKNIWRFLDLPTGTTLLLVLLLSVVSVCLQVLQIYFASCIGHLFRRMRVFWSVMFFYIINVVMEISMTVGMVIFDSTGMLYEESTAAVNGLLAIVLAVECVLGVVYFFVSERILRKRLNLE